MEYDLAIHLAGKQAIPNLLGIRNIPAKRHLLFTSDETSYTLERLKRCVPDKTVDEVSLTDPFDLQRIIDTVRQEIGTGGLRTAVNLTGGTKPMSLGASKGASGTGSSSTFYYFDTENERMLHWRQETAIQAEPIQKSLSIDDFIRLSAFDVQKEGTDMAIVTARKELSRKIWEYRKPYTYSTPKESSIQSAAQAELNKASCGQTFPKEVTRDGKTVFLDYADGNVRSFQFDHKGEDFALTMRLDLKYLAGGWFEEFVYWTLKPQEEKGEIREMRLGMKVMFDQKENSPAQEFDLLVTDGLRLLILECKAGRIEQKNLDKLENVTYQFAGNQGLGVLIARWYQKPSSDSSLPTIERTKKSRRYACLHGDDLKKILREGLFKLKPGDIVPSVGD